MSSCQDNDRASATCIALLTMRSCAGSTVAEYNQVVRDFMLEGVRRGDTSEKSMALLCNALLDITTEMVSAYAFVEDVTPDVLLQRSALTALQHEH